MGGCGPWRATIKRNTYLIAYSPMPTLCTYIMISTLPKRLVCTYGYVRHTYVCATYVCMCVCARACEKEALIYRSVWGNVRECVGDN